MVRQRIETIQKMVHEKKWDALFIEDPIDLLYLTGLSVSTGRLVVFPKRCILFVDGRYFEVAKRTAPCEVMLRDDKVLAALLETDVSIGFDSAFLSYEAVRNMEKNIPGKKWVAIPEPVRELRICKDKHEIDALQKAADLTWRGYQHILSLLKPGVTEEELAFAFELFCRRHGASRLSFEPIIAFGENSAYPHYRAGKAQLREGQNVLIDIGAVVEGYCGDFTRVAFFGAPNTQILRDYELLQRVQKLAIEAVHPGVLIGELDRIVRDELRREGCEALFTHGLGHGVGLKIHEAPSLKPDSADAKQAFKAGMVFTIEPGIYRPGIGGVRYEDMILCTKDGAKNLYP